MISPLFNLIPSSIIRANSDIHALEQFTLERLTKVSGIKNVKSSFALKHAKYKTALPVGG